MVQAADDAVLPGHRPREIEAGFAQGDAEPAFARGEACNLAKFISRMDQSLGRNAANVEAGSARPPGLYDHGVDAELPCANRTDIAAGSCADHQKLAEDLFHGLSLP
ncbi:MAG: hypothetical protein K0Q89_1745 [Thermomicrobiales bacterium]|nr:hypothetical protein [Thermomicrobiales bacterium]